MCMWLFVGVSMFVLSWSKSQSGFELGVGGGVGVYMCVCWGRGLTVHRCVLWGKGHRWVICGCALIHCFFLPSPPSYPYSASNISSNTKPWCCPSSFLSQRSWRLAWLSAFCHTSRTRSSHCTSPATPTSQRTGER